MSNFASRRRFATIVYWALVFVGLQPPLWLSSEWRKAIECAGGFVLSYDKGDLIERLNRDVASDAVSKTLVLTLESHQFCVGVCIGLFLLRSERMVVGC